MQQPTLWSEPTQVRHFLELIWYGGHREIVEIGSARWLETRDDMNIWSAGFVYDIKRIRDAGFPVENPATACCTK